jgi:hypothetical protein
MFKFSLIFAFCVFSFYWSHSQSSYGPDFKTDIPKVIPPSPNAAAFEKFNVIPVDYSTGVPAISYPFFSWSRNRLSFDLGLSYHAGGHKVEDMSSNVGLGWTLTGLGRVTRTVRGIPDDKPNYGFIHSPILPQVATSMYSGYYYFTSPYPITTSYNELVTEENCPDYDDIQMLLPSHLEIGSMKEPGREFALL